MPTLHLWQHPDFPHFYANEVIVSGFESDFRAEMAKLNKLLLDNKPNLADVLTGEVIANSEIEGISLDRESVNSSFVNNITPGGKKEKGAVTLTKMALSHFGEPLTHSLLFSMHREIMQGSEFPEESVGTYVGDMKVVSGGRLDREFTVIHEGAPKDQVHAMMTDYITWYNSCNRDTPLMNAIRGHIHFETLHPFCDGNGRIGRTLILMGLCRDFPMNIPLALSRTFNSSLKDYYSQFNTDLDLTDVVKSTAPMFLSSVHETIRILELTTFRTKVSNVEEALNKRQLKVLHRMIDYELRDGFRGGINNRKYQKMTGIGDRTALRDLDALHRLGLMRKTGQLKGTRYHLNFPDRQP